MYLSNIHYLLISICLVLLTLLSVAFFTLSERKIMASIQARKGPTRVGFLGLLQPITDGVKLILKETVYPRNSFFAVFFISPLIAFLFGFLSWSIIPLGYDSVISNFNYGLMFILIISIFHVYSIILAGWSSNSKYAFLGAIRSSAQLIAYDIPLGLIVVTIFLVTKSLNITKIIEFQMSVGWMIFYYPILFLMFLVCILAETNRHPFDLPEAESELVSGYNVEYSASGFALFFLGEYSSIILASILCVNLFFGGWDTLIDLNNYIYNYYVCTFIIYFVYVLKLFIFIFLFVYIRASIPRYKYNQLMSIGWKYILPLSLFIFMVNAISFKFLI